MPRLAELRNDLAAAGVDFVTVDQDESADSATRYLQRHRYGWTNYHDGDGSVGKAFGVEALPTTVLIDRDGQIAFEDHVMDGPSEQQLMKAISESAQIQH